MKRPPASLRKRLWLAGGGVGLFLLTLVCAGPFFDRTPDAGKLGLGYDFLPAYVAGHFARTGEFAKMYDRAAFADMQTRVIREADLEMDGRFGAGLNPPHFALLFAPLSALPYRTAAVVWCVTNVLLLGASLALLVRMVPGDWKTRGLVPLLVVVSMPFCQATGHQQNTFLSLLLLTAAVTCWRGGLPFAAGATVGLLFYKPQLALVVSLVLVADLGWRAALGLGLIGAVTLLVTLVVMPGALGEYLHTLPVNVDWIQNKLQYNWGRQVTFLGFWRLLAQGREVGPVTPLVRALWALSALPVAIALATAFVRVRRARSAGADSTASRDRLITASVACTPLLLPYFMDYDLLLLAVPAVLFAADVMRMGQWTWTDRWTLRAWVALGVWSYVNPGLSGVLHVSLTVPLLALVVMGLVRKCSTNTSAEIEPEQAPAPRRLNPADRPPLAA